MPSNAGDGKKGDPLPNWQSFPQRKLGIYREFLRKYRIPLDLEFEGSSFVVGGRFWSALAENSLVFPARPVLILPEDAA